MPKLHEVLAVEKTTSSTSGRLMAETMAKFAKVEYFQGFDKSLKMLNDNLQNESIEAAAAETRQLPTTVYETLEYALEFWAQAEDVTYQKNVSNRSAVADLMFKGEILAKDVPVDELLGLETRLTSIRKVFDMVPTLSASIRWSKASDLGRDGAWIAEPEVTTKTEKTTKAVVLYEATKEHPAQVREVSTDVTIGTFQLIRLSGGATSAQKAKLISAVDTLIAEVKQARMRANSIEASKEKIGGKLTELFMKAFDE